MDWIEYALGTNWNSKLSVPSWFIFLIRIGFIVLLFMIGQFVYETSMPMIVVSGDGSSALSLGSIALFENINSIQVGDIILAEQNNYISFSSKPISKEQYEFILNKDNNIKVHGRLFFSIPYLGYITLCFEYTVCQIILIFIIAFCSSGLLGNYLSTIHTKFWSFMLAFITLYLYAWIYVALMIKFSADLPQKGAKIEI